MFAKNQNQTPTTKSAEAESNSINIIGVGTTITGDIQSNGDIRIDGNLKVNLVTKGKLVVGPSGSITGDIQCKNADISGKIEGKISVSELLTLKASSKFTGDIITGKLAIEPGAIFTGTCSMNGGSVTSPQSSIAAK